VSGFWHGASWNFIAWGGIHAVGFLPLLLLNRNRANVGEVVAANSMLPSIKEFGQMLLTFTFVTFAWIFFRAESILAALDYLKNITAGLVNVNDSKETVIGIKVILFILPLVVADWYLRSDERTLKVPSNFRYPLYLILITLVFFMMLRAKESSFIYFQF
jgi:D-alanyl-lipoteichoic acid acyltransferase DltB (MBOAT superfamily)